MIDTFRHLHSEKKAYSFYPGTKALREGCDRVDMRLISKSLKGEAGMHESPSERGPSDHVPLYACLNFEEGEGSKLET